MPSLISLDKIISSGCKPIRIRRVEPGTFCMTIKHSALAQPLQTRSKFLAACLISGEVLWFRNSKIFGRRFSPQVSLSEGHLKDAQLLKDFHEDIVLKRHTTSGEVL
ncbi:hypothetical protein M8J77_004795 [Diaphorina citri]|nr:hypothetical protein M8J77_004795 [Diaphorina citri]